jgi:hypothetical protein
MTRQFFHSTIVFFCFLVITKTYAQINPSSNYIGVDVSTLPQNPSFNYDSSFSIGKKLGMSRVGLFQNWTAIETTPLNYNMLIFDIANIYYPISNMAVDLTIAPIHTNNLEVPSDLVNITFDSPVFINRFNRLLDSIKVHTPNLVLSSLVIGSEHDVYLNTNAALWTQYTNFYNAVIIYAKSIWPGLKVGTELTFNGMLTQNTFAQTLNMYSDYIGISYYPLNSNFTVKPISTIPTDFATLVNLYPLKPLYFYQYGYPSSATCNSSEFLQAQFISQTFQSWDTYATNIKMIDFTWLHDLDTAIVNFYSTYYGISDTIFLEYLRTLGLRKWHGIGMDKLAMSELRCQAKQRGYNLLNLNCSSNVNSSVSDDLKFSVFPNPANDVLNIDSQNSEPIFISICDEMGKCLYKSYKLEPIPLQRFANGVYYLKLLLQNASIVQKVSVQH